MTRDCSIVFVALCALLGCDPPATADRKPLAAHAVAPAQQAEAHASAPSAPCPLHPALEAAAPLPGASLYHLEASLTDPRNETRTLASFRGEPLLVTMFYGSCTTICPLIIGHLQRVEAALPETARGRARFLLVSLDPARDSVAALAKLAERHGVDTARWHFVRASDASVQEIAAVLGVRYRRMPDGEISHSPTVALLDRDGVIAARTEVPQRDPGELARPWLALLGDSAQAHAAAP